MYRVTRLLVGFTIIISFFSFFPDAIIAHAAVRIIILYTNNTIVFKR